MNSYKYRIDNGYLHIFPCVLDISWTLNIDIECNCGRYQNIANGTQCMRCGEIHKDAFVIIHKISILLEMIKNYKLLRLFFDNKTSKELKNILKYQKDNLKLYPKAFEYLIKHIDNILTEIEMYILRN